MSQEKHSTKSEERKKRLRENSKRWRLKNLERCRQKSRDYAAKNRDKINARVRELRALNIEKYREINRKAVAKFRTEKPESYYKIQRKYDLENPDKRLEKSKRYQNKFPKKLEAQKLVNLAIKQGKLERLPCQHCGNPKSEGHHADYSKPLEVQWLCKKHHVAWHKLFTAVGGE